MGLLVTAWKSCSLCREKSTQDLSVRPKATICSQPHNSNRGLCPMGISSTTSDAVSVSSLVCEHNGNAEKHHFKISADPVVRGEYLQGTTFP